MAVGEYSGTRAARTRVIGIGASAGGLAALELFFQNVPTDSGLAYVVVQHLDPNERSLLPELLQRVTSLSVKEAGERMVLEPNCVYVIPPNTEISVTDGVLRSEAPEQVRGMRLPINVLFSSLAREQGERSIAVVLSGMGSDGTAGLQAIKALGGLTGVQEPTSAQFDSMPRSAIAAGCADIIAAPAELPARILDCIARSRPPSEASVAGAQEEAAKRALQSIVGQLRQRSGHDFSLYKTNTLRRRIDRRMAIHGVGTLVQYADFLGTNPQEINLLFKELLIGVTSFFRDAAVWQHLADVTLPDLLARRGKGEKFRVWVIGCSTGEEAYSLAMVFAEVLERLPQYRDRELQIFASDLSADAIAIARSGEYPAAISADVSPARLARFFSPHGDRYRISKVIRDSVLFAQHDVVLDPPFTKLDLISCRNLMIYFDAQLQKRTLPLFHYSLKSGGVLLLGSSETVGRFDRLFVPMDSKLRLYSRCDRVSGGPSDFLLKSLLLPTETKKDHRVTPLQESDSAADSLQIAADHVLLQVHSPPAVVVNEAGDIVYISGRTGNYLEPAAGRANLNFHAMVREGLRSALAGALEQAAAQVEPLTLRGLKVQAPGRDQIVDVTLHRLVEPAALRGKVMVVFRDVATPAGRRRRKGPGDDEAAHLAELQRCRDENQSLREEARASREELQSANEELQSTNEELQSTNEELTTSKEEMQSMNEELQTINAEMQTRLDDLSLAQSDMKNLLNSTDIAMLFLDKDLNVRRYTDRAAKIINLRESDVGRPLTDLTSSLQYSSLHEDVRETVRTLIFSEKQILASDGRWFTVRIMPYRKLDNVIDGAVITFVDITAIKELEARLRGDSNLAARDEVRR